MNARTVLLLALTAIVGGCGTVSTIQPLHSEDKLTFNEKLLGVWASDPNDPNDNIRIERLEDSNNAYKLTFSQDKGKGLFELRLVKLDDHLYFDIAPAAWPSGTKDLDDMPYAYNGLHFLRLHSFGRLDAIEPNLIVRLSSEDDMKKLLEQDPNAIAHAFAEEDKLLITASTKELQAFVVKYRDNDKVFAEPTPFYRLKIGAPGEPACSTEKGQGSGG